MHISRTALVFSGFGTTPSPLPAIRGPDVWIHADLLAAETLLPPRARGTYRDALGVDDATWERGRGWALVEATMALPDYVDTNPVMAATARHTPSALLEADGPERGR